MPEFLPTPETADVEWYADEGTAELRLNRPRAINALTTAMCAAISGRLGAWEHDDDIARVEITGAGEKGLCAGGDIRAVRELVLAGDLDAADAFFATEYAMNAAIARYPKPVTARLWGVVMGGGLGVAAHASRRIIAPEAKVAMPETIIGFFPDVGMRWLLARAGRWGDHLALTGATINAADAVRVGFADEVDGEPPAATLTDAEWLDCYAAPSAADAVARLEAHEDPRAREAAAAIRQRSPLAVCVSFAGLARARRAASLDDVLAEDLVIARHIIRQPDFAEGVRAQLVDKDRSPRWQHARIEDVPDSAVAAILG